MNLSPPTADGRPRIGAGIWGARYVATTCLALLLGVFASGKTAQAGTCGKHYLVLQPGTHGALVEVLVEKRNREAAESHPSDSREKCDSPLCRLREQAPVAPSTPWTRITLSSSAVDLFWIAESERALSARSVQYWNEAGLLYDLEPAPPPTPPPRS